MDTEKQNPELNETEDINESTNEPVKKLYITEDGEIVELTDKELESVVGGITYYPLHKQR